MKPCLVLSVLILFCQLATAQSSKLSSPQTVEGVTVSVVGVDPERKLMLEEAGRQPFSYDEPRFTIELLVQVKGKTRSFLSWGDTAATNGAVVKDDTGAVCRRASPGGRQGLVGSTFYLEMSDGESAPDLIVIQPPVATAKTLTLVLPGSRIGLKSDFVFSIDREVWAPKPRPKPKVELTTVTKREQPKTAEIVEIVEIAPEMTEEEQEAVRRDRTTVFGMTIGIFVVVFIVLVAFGMLPFLIAILRGHNSAAAIFLVCLFLGWTWAGWLVALIWSFTGDTVANDQRRARYGRND